MAESRERSKFKQNPPLVVPRSQRERMVELRYDILGILLLCLSTFLFVCNMYPDATGVIGRLFLSKVMIPLFGKGVLLFPVYTAVLGLFVVFGYAYVHFFLRFIGLLTGFFSFITLIELFVNGKFLSFSWQHNDHGGGLCGYVISYFLQWLMGIKGAYIFIVTMALISMLLIFDIKVRDVLRFLMAVFFVIVRVLRKLFSFRLRRATESIATPVTAARTSRAATKKAIVPIVEDIDTSVTPAHQEDPAATEKQREAIRKKLFGDTLSEATAQDPLATTPEKSSVTAELPRIAIQTELPLSTPMTYNLPSIDLLNDHKTAGFKKQSLQEEIIKTTQRLEDTFASFKIDAKVVSISQGPAVTRYELQPAPGVKVSKIVNLADDLALSLAASGIRIEAPIPGKSVVGIEVPNKNVETVNLISLARTEKFEDKIDKLLVAIGLDIEGAPVFMNLAAMPHLLVAGATGSGKSVCINTLIISILLRATPMEVRFLMIDPKQVELSSYNGIPHLLAPVVTDPSKAAATLKWAVLEMNNRYEEFAKIGARNLEAFNLKVEEMTREYTEDADKVFIPSKKPYIVVIIDELADLMMVASGDVETMIARLAQMARATGIHLVVATQRPSVDVITGLIKANIPSRISFAVSSQIDSRTILDAMGAEKLLGKGDMLYKPVGAMKSKRVQGVYISDKEINKIVNFVKQNGAPQYVDEVVNIKADDFKLEEDAEADPEGDALFLEAKQIIQSTGQASTSFLQRKLKIGYNRAARIMDEMEQKGIISAYDGDSKTRTVLKYD